MVNGRTTVSSELLRRVQTSLEAKRSRRVEVQRLTTEKQREEADTRRQREIENIIRAGGAFFTKSGDKFTSLTETEARRRLIEGGTVFARSSEEQRRLDKLGFGKLKEPLPPKTGRDIFVSPRGQIFIRETTRVILPISGIEDRQTRLFGPPGGFSSVKEAKRVGGDPKARVTSELGAARRRQLRRTRVVAVTKAGNIQTFSTGAAAEAAGATIVPSGTGGVFAGPSEGAEVISLEEGLRRARPEPIKPTEVKRMAPALITAPTPIEKPIERIRPIEQERVRGAVVGRGFGVAGLVRGEEVRMGITGRPVTIEPPERGVPGKPVAPGFEGLFIQTRTTIKPGIIRGEEGPVTGIRPAPLAPSPRIGARGGFVIGPTPPEQIPTPPVRETVFVGPSLKPAREEISRRERQQILLELAERGLPLIPGERVGVEERLALGGLRAGGLIRGRGERGIISGARAGIGGIVSGSVATGFQLEQIGKRLATPRGRALIGRAAREVPEELALTAPLVAAAAVKGARERPLFAVGFAIGTAAGFVLPARGVRGVRVARQRIKLAQTLRETRATRPLVFTEEAGLVTPTTRVTVAEKLRLALGKPEKVPKTITEAVELSKSRFFLERQALPEKVIVTPKKVKGKQPVTLIERDIAGFQIQEAIATQPFKVEFAVFGKQRKGFVKPGEGFVFKQIVQKGEGPLGQQITTIKPVALERGLAGIARIEGARVGKPLERITGLILEPTKETKFALGPVKGKKVGKGFVLERIEPSPKLAPSKVRGITPTRAVTRPGARAVPLITPKLKLELEPKKKEEAKALQITRGIQDIKSKRLQLTTQITRVDVEEKPKTLVITGQVPGIRQRRRQGIIVTQIGEPGEVEKTKPKLALDITPRLVEEPKQEPRAILDISRPKIPERPGKPIGAISGLTFGQTTTKPRTAWFYEVFFPGTGWVPGFHGFFETELEARRVGASVVLRGNGIRFRTRREKTREPFESVPFGVGPWRLLKPSFRMTAGNVWQIIEQQSNPNSGFGSPAIKNNGNGNPGGRKNTSKIRKMMIGGKGSMGTGLTRKQLQGAISDAQKLRKKREQGLLRVTNKPRRKPGRAKKGPGLISRIETGLKKPGGKPKKGVVGKIGSRKGTGGKLFR